jgi:hypothetical protein
VVAAQRRNNSSSVAGGKYPIGKIMGNFPEIFQQILVIFHFLEKFQKNSGNFP